MRQNLTEKVYAPEPMLWIKIWHTAFREAEFCASIWAAGISIFHWHYPCEAGKTASFLGLRVHSNPVYQPPTTITYINKEIGPGNPHDLSLV